MPKGSPERTAARKEEIFLALYEREYDRWNRELQSILHDNEKLTKQQIAEKLATWAIAKGTLPIIGVTKENQVLDAVKAANITLTEEEVSSLEKVADSLDLNVIRFWEKEMK